MKMSFLLTPLPALSTLATPSTNSDLSNSPVAAPKGPSVFNIAPVGNPSQQRGSVWVGHVNRNRAVKYALAAECSPIVVVEANVGNFVEDTRALTAIHRARRLSRGGILITQLAATESANT